MHSHGASPVPRPRRFGLAFIATLAVLALTQLTGFASTARAELVAEPGDHPPVINVGAVLNGKSVGNGIESNSGTQPGPNATSCIVTVLPQDNSTSANGRAPSTKFSSNHGVYLISASELAANGFGAGVVPTSIGWDYQTAPGNSGSASLKIYMQNTADATYSKGTSYTAAIAGMTKVHDAVTTLPGTAGTFDITMTGGVPFTYTGGGLYIAFDWDGFTGPLSTTTVVWCNSLGMPAGGLASSQSIIIGTPAADAMGLSAFRPETRLTSTVQNNVAVEIVYSLGSLPIGLTGPQIIRALVKNRGAVDQANVDVTLNITGANSFSNTQTIGFLSGCGGSAEVLFSAWTPTALGSNTVTVSVNPDDVNADNSKSKPLNVTLPTYSYKYPGTTATGGVGVGGQTATFVAKFTTTAATSLTQAIAEFTGAGTHTYKVVVYGDDGFGFPGAQLYLDAANRTFVGSGTATITLPSPIPTGPGSIFVGIQQVTTTNVALSYDSEDPIRVGAFYLETPIGSGFLEANADQDPFKFNLGATFDRCDPSLVAGSNSPICAGQTLQLTASATNGFTYSWTGPAGFTSNQQNPTIPNATAANSGTYTVFVNGCATGVSTSVTVTPRIITASAGPGGSISPSGSVALNCGANQTFTISAASCFDIADVVVDGNSVGAVSSYTFLNVQTDHTISASFSPKPPFTINASAGPGGSITPSGAVSAPCGSDQTFSIAGDACHTIANVLVDGNPVGPVSSYTFLNVQANHTISASFSLINYTINASAGPNGSITPSGAVLVGCGANQTFTITPNAGYNINDVLVDAVSVGAVASYTFNNVTANHTISASFAIAQDAVIGAQSTLTAICPSNPCVTLPVTINRPTNQAVLGFSVTIQLSANLSLCGSGISEGTFLSSAGATTFQVINNGGGNYTVDGAVLGNDCGPTGNTGTLFNVSVTSSDPGGTGSITTVSTTLRDCNNQPLPSVPGSPGTVPIDNQAPTATLTSPNGGEFYAIGSSQKISWTASDNTSVASIDLHYSTDGGATYPNVIATGLSNSGTYVWSPIPNTPTNLARVRVTAHDAGCLSAADASDANFTIDTPTITATAGPGGSISPSGAVQVPFGNDQTFTITANACYHIADVVVDGNSVGPVSSYTFQAVSTNHTINASFAIDIETISASAGPGGSISPSGNVPVNCGSDQSFTIAPNACFAIQDVVVDGNSVGAVASYTFINVTANHTISASFVSTSVPTTTALTIAPEPSACQQKVNLTATVSPASATGSVEFFDGATSLGTAAVVGGMATLSVTFSVVGPHTLGAVYTPVGCFVGSSDAQPHTVVKATPTVSVTSDINPSTFGQAVTFTATVVPATATGTITFRDSLAVIGTAPLSGGTASIVKSNMVVGLHTQVTATYGGDACYASKTSPGYAQRVNQRATAAEVQSDINPKVCGDRVRLSGIITPIGATGPVIFRVDGNFAGQANINPSTGVATLFLGNMLAGKHNLTCEYNGNQNYLASSSAEYSIVCSFDASSVSMVSGPSPAKYGALVTLTATVQPDDAFGSVDFYDGATYLGTGEVQGDHTASYSFTTQLAPGSHSLHAQYTGDGCHDPSISSDVVQEITPDAQPVVHVVFPNGNETLCIGGDVKLIWTASDNTSVTSVQLEISRDFGGTWETIVASMGNTGSYVWRVTPPGTNVGPTQVFSALFRVTATDNAGVTGSDESDTFFSIFDCAVGVTVTRLDAVPADNGIQLRWAFSEPSAFAKVVIERSVSEQGPWTELSADMSDDAGEMVATDRTAEASHTYFYRLVGTSVAGSRVVFGPVRGTSGAPREFSMSAAWPNPSRGQLSLKLAVPKTSNLRLTVVDLQGREVAELMKGAHAPGVYQVTWDGRTDRGPVATGLYFLRLVTPEKDFNQRVTIAR